MSELSHYIKLRSGLSGCDAKLFECDKYLDCDSCLEDKIKEHDKQIRADAIDDFAKYIREKVLFEKRWLVDCKSSNANTNIAFSSIMTFINSVAEELKKVEIQ